MSIKPTYQQVEVHAEVIVNDDADLAEVSDAIEKSLLDYFHPLKGGEDGLGWPFGGTIYYSRVYQRVFTVPGVQSIESLIIGLDRRNRCKSAGRGDSGRSTLAVLDGAQRGGTVQL